MNLPELSILKLLLKYEMFQTYCKYVKISPELREIKTLFYALERLHEKFPGTDKTVEDLEIMVQTSYPNMRQIEKEALHELLTRTSTISVSEEVVDNLLRQVQIRASAHELALGALEVAEGRRDPSSLGEIWERTQTQSGDESVADDRCFVTDDLFELEHSSVMGPGLSWRLDCLNRSLGPLRDGDFGFVFARPESGKTTFLADQCTFMAGQAERPVIWFNNEEQGEKVRFRTYHAALGITQDDLWVDKKKTLEEYRKVTKDQLKIYDDAKIHRRDVERIIGRFNPSLVVFDQIDKIEGFKADRPDLVYGRIYQWARELAKGQRAIIGVCQADGTGEGVRWLTMAHVAEAKTSKQGEADWILGIGRSHDAGTEDIRYLNISKNKLLGDQNTDPRERHGRFPVFIQPSIARYKDID